MKRLILVLCSAYALFIPISLWGQLVCIGDGCSCDKEDAVLPNLSIAKPVKLTGALFDPTGAPITFEKTLVQIRDSKSTTVLFSVPLDVQGRFDLGTVPAGKYRFLAVWFKGGKISRLPLADQPTALVCSDDAECNLKIVIHFHGTDMPFESCPPK
jgi:glyoxylate carboligase